MPFSRHGSGRDQPLELGAQGRIGQPAKRSATPVPTRPSLAGVRTCLGDDRVDAVIGLQWLTAVQAPEGRKQASTAEPCGRIGRIAGHPAVGSGTVPSTAMRIASLSSSESWWREAPFSTGLAKTRVFARP